jgi:hypothetical protein
MAKRTPGLRKQVEIWHVDKIIGGVHIRKSTGETELEQAERFLAKLVEQYRQVKESWPQLFKQTLSIYK